MMLFIPYPQKGILSKLKKYIGIDSSMAFSIKQFSYTLAHAFPSVNKLIRNFFTAKFKGMAKNTRLLKHFSSAIIRDEAVILALKTPELTGAEIKKLYSNEDHKSNFFDLEKKIIGYSGPWMLLIESVDETGTYKFGAFQAGPISDVEEYQGTTKGYMFTVEPNFRFMHAEASDKAKHFFFINTIDEVIGKKSRGIGFGGDNHKEDFKLWVDERLNKSTVYNGYDMTYGYGTLANPVETTLKINKM
jgi:hypothetical protein